MPFYNVFVIEAILIDIFMFLFQFREVITGDKKGGIR